MKEHTKRREARPSRTHGRRGAHPAWLALFALLPALCIGAVACSRSPGASEWSRFRVASPAPDLVQGAEILVAMGCNVSSGTAHVGDEWHGTVTQCVWIGGEGVIPPGSEVTGVVTAVCPATWDTPGVLQLGIRSIRVNGHAEPIDASSVSVVAGTATARAAGLTPADSVDGASGIQVVLSDVSVMTFAVDRTVAVR